ncbi:(Na+)-NQR maturation NqrM [Phaeobacter sp. QD34_3]|uniref:(Na+)-NQR maturation NqrM n=1 Tax=unclassified Phaeobacter TaxID=2621772 RepID=UPI00237F5BE7|nr:MULTISPECIES: (Na+)-NQR maturation NqrM [unclassified Phaeobacter]MDE4132458.1 (Na+)-NQR maturation NqrM [Phaeobacter sp. QD34_3]MDE4136095.1 (Na+)-NQR maturation NqrM [Phaeobacter sp. QD34_24]MDE4175883.1 (Na+)-NQR maturation NqrM [Phaeobacter sp. PT47_59]
MTTFLFTFGLLLLIMLGMALGVILMNKTIKGSCGGLNAISGADKCLVCSKDIDPDSPLRDRLQCPRKRQIMEQAQRMEKSA